MYEPRRPRQRRPLKKRTARALLRPLATQFLLAQAGWLTAVPLGPIVVPPRVIPRIFTFLKKLIRYPKTRARFWVNAQCAHLITRKPLNVRMGKGKGAKVRLYTALGGGCAVAAVSHLRAGFRTRLRRFVAIRLGRPVALLTPTPTATPVLWAQRHRTQTASTRHRAQEVKALLALIRRPGLKVFFSRLFRAAWRRPRLRWRFWWASVPPAYARCRARRGRWGTGVRTSAPLWAGLNALFLGTRRQTPLAAQRQKRVTAFEEDLTKLVTDLDHHPDPSAHVSQAASALVPGSPRWWRGAYAMSFTAAWRPFAPRPLAYPGASAQALGEQWALLGLSVSLAPTTDKADSRALLPNQTAAATTLEIGQGALWGWLQGTGYGGPQLPPALCMGQLPDVARVAIQPSCSMADVALTGVVLSGPRVQP